MQDILVENLKGLVNIVNTLEQCFLKKEMRGCRNLIKYAGRE